ADDPPPVLVKRLTQRFLDTDGDLKEMTRTLIASPEAWEPQQAKIKRPGEWIVAALRATGETGEIGRIIQAGNLLGEPLWRPPAPQGFSDENAAWLDGLAQLLEMANAFAHREGLALEPKAIMETALGPLASAETQQNGPLPSQKSGRMYSGTKPGISKASAHPASKACLRMLLP